MKTGKFISYKFLLTSLLPTQMTAGNTMRQAICSCVKPVGEFGAPQLPQAHDVKNANDLHFSELGNGCSMTWR